MPERDLEGVLGKCDEILAELERKEEINRLIDRFSGKNVKNIKKLKSEVEEKLLKQIVDASCITNVQMACSAYLNFKQALSLEDNAN